MKTPIATEHEEQSRVVEWFSVKYPSLRGLLFSVPNGAHLAGSPRLRAAKMHFMKREGFRPGVSDLFLMVARDPWHGLWIEMKRQGARPSDTRKEQLQFLQDAAVQGYQGVVCHGADAAMAAITEYLGQQARAAA